MTTRRNLPHVKTVRAKGHSYEYFVSGKTSNGKPLLLRLPAKTDPTFGTVYARYVAARARRVEQPTVAGVVRAYEASPAFHKLAAGSQRTYGFYLARMVREMGGAPIDDVERRDIYKLIEGLKPSASNMQAIVARIVFEFAIKREMTKDNPASAIEKYEGGEHQPWPEELVELALADEDWLIRLAVALLYFSAQRIGDVCRMRPSDIRGGVLFVTQEKTGKDLEIPVHARLAEIIVLSLSPFMLLHGRGGRPARPDYIRARLKRWAAERGHSIVPHGLRKNAVNALLEAGCSTGETASISGQSLRLVEFYAKRRNNRAMAKGAILKWENVR